MAFILSILFWISLIYLIYFYGFFMLLLSKYLYVPKFSKLPLKLPSASIVICTFNEERVIKEKIKNTLAINYPSSKLKILIVDGGSTDRTAKIVMEEIKKRKSKNIAFFASGERKGKANDLNFALKYCKTDFFVTTDANTMLNKGCVKEALRVFFSNVKVGCVTGRRIIPELENIVEFGERDFWEIDSLIKLCQSNFSNLPGIIGEFAMYKTQILRKIGGFDENAVAEDFESALKIIKLGYRILFCHKCEASEPAPKSIRDLYERRARATFGILQAMFKHKDILFNPKYKEFGMWLLPTQRLFFVFSPFAIGIILYVFFDSLFKGMFSIPLTTFFSALLVLLIIKKIERDNPLSKERFMNKKAFSGVLHISVDQAAILGGLWRFIFKTQKVTWKKLETTR